MPPKRNTKKKVEEEEEVEETEVDYSKKTVPQLKELCKARGLPVGGRKQDLIDRLNGEEDEEEDDEMEDEAVPEPSKKKKAPKETKSTKKAKVEKEDDDEEEEEPKEEKASSRKKGGKAKPDEVFTDTASLPKCSLPLGTRKGATIYQDKDGINWKVSLNQTNVGANNNKYYYIQLLVMGSTYLCWTRWGRVGDTRLSNTGTAYGGLDQAQKEFYKKFKDKTGNDWAVIRKKPDAFVKKNGKYDLVELAEDDDDEEEEALAVTTKGKQVTVRPCTLDAPTKKLCELIFDVDMFKEQMKQFDIDTNKMPLGKLSKEQLKKGFDILEQLKDAVENRSSSGINEYSGRFYSAIPHDFGYSQPPAINTLEGVQRKFDLLETLGDILMAKKLIDTVKDESADEVPHPLDVQYNELKNNLQYVDHKTDEFKWIQKFVENTKGRNVKIIDVWRTDRSGELDRSKHFKSIANRKLLWHGTSPAVVVAILKTGLRIMPHSGGRVGRGIYFASENAKSAGYVGTTRHRTEGNKSVGFMFLNEVALGNQYKIQQDDSSLRKAPNGYDSVWAQGSVEPDPKDDFTIEGSFGNKITVPLGKKINTGIKSSFLNSEYLIYDEAQTYMRYMLKCDFS